MRLLGLKNCDRCRNALKELRDAGAEVELIEIRDQKISEDELELILSQFGEALINRRSTTWRGIENDERQQDPKALLAKYPTLMKRPVIERDGRYWLGWTPQIRAEVLAQS